MTPRAHINMETRLASALLALGHVPYDDAKLMTAKQLISLYHFDHGILHGIDPVDWFWNLTPRLIIPHREKSKRDKAIVSKVARIARANDAAVNRLLARAEGEPAQPQRLRGRAITSRPFPKGHRPLRSRNDLRRR